MNYTISTEPVTEEHIGRRVLVKDLPGDEWIKAILTDIVYYQEENFSCSPTETRHYRVNDSMSFEYAILIVEN